MLLWNHDVSILITYSSSNLIICDVEVISTGLKWGLICVYGPSVSGHQSDVWNRIKEYGNSASTPWCCIGDFNAVVYPSEKSGGALSSQSQMKDFREMIHSFSLMDLGFKGPAYTWSNRRKANFHIRERLDRSLASPEWRLLYSGAHVLHLPAINSDHAPLLLSLFQEPKSSKPMFRFEAMWLKDPAFLNIIGHKWHGLSASDELPLKLKLLRHFLYKWGQHNFSNFRKELNLMRKRISYIQGCEQSDESLVEDTYLQMAYNHLLEKEDIFWWQRARMNWINYGDRNTKFFHI